MVTCWPRDHVGVLVPVLLLMVLEVKALGAGWVAAEELASTLAAANRAAVAQRSAMMREVGVEMGDEDVDGWRRGRTVVAARDSDSGSSL